MPLGGFLRVHDTSVFNNTTSGVFDIQDDATIDGSLANPNYFINAGLLKKTGGENVAYISCIFTNTGTISVEHGTLTMGVRNKTFDGGVYNVATGSALVLDTQINVNDELTGVLDGPMNWASAVSVATAATFNFTGASAVTWTSGGGLNGGGTLTNESTIILNSNGTRNITGGTTLTNNGVVTMPLGGLLKFYAASVFNNTTSGVFDIQEDATIDFHGSANFLNAGLLEKTGGVNTAYIKLPSVTNSGTINVSSGTLEFTWGLTNTADGIVQGTATIALPTAANFTNDGTFSPGGYPGTLTVNGDFKSSPTSNLQIELYGPTQGTEYDLLAVQGNAIMDGDIPVALYFAPNIGDEFIVLTANDITSCNLPSTISASYDNYNYTFDVICNSNNVTLKVTEIVLGIEKNTLSNLSLYPNPSNGTFAIDMGREYPDVTVRIYNLTGQIISSEKYSSARIIEKQIDNLPGIYFVNVITTSGESTTLKMILQ